MLDGKDVSKKAVNAAKAKEANNIARLKELAFQIIYEMEQDILEAARRGEFRVEIKGLKFFLWRREFRELRSQVDVSIIVNNFVVFEDRIEWSRCNKGEEMIRDVKCLNCGHVTEKTLMSDVVTGDEVGLFLCDNCDEYTFSRVLPPLVGKGVVR